MNELHALVIPAEKFSFILIPLCRKVRAEGQLQKNTLGANRASFQRTVKQVGSFPACWT